MTASQQAFRPVWSVVGRSLNKIHGGTSRRNHHLARTIICGLSYCKLSGKQWQGPESGSGDVENNRRVLHSKWTQFGNGKHQKSAINVPPVQGSDSLWAKTSFSLWYMPCFWSATWSHINISWGICEILLFFFAPFFLDCLSPICFMPQGT